MSAFSTFKTGVKAALNVPHFVQKSRSRRQVITFNEALENLKTSQTGFVICAAFHSFGRCRKEIPLLDSKFLANLDHLDLSDVQTPIKLMPLMLCSTHWGKTIYHNALFLDWLSAYGSKQDHPQFETTVVDYQSAIVISNKESSWPDDATSPRSTLEGQDRPKYNPNSSKKDHNYLEIQDRLGQVQLHSDHEAPSLPEIEPNRAAPNLPEISVLVGMESYASIELGVASLEIFYQEALRCIAMTSDGWRCPTIIQKEQQIMAQELLSSLASLDSEVDIDHIPRSVLCSGHAIGELPRMYAEKWATFLKQRLPKEEAMSKFNADFWMSIQFFSNETRDNGTFRMHSSSRSRPASRPSSRSRNTFDLGSVEDAGEISPTPQVMSPWISATQNFEYVFPNHLSNSSVRTMPSREDILEPPSSSEPSSHFVGTQRRPELLPEEVSMEAESVDKRTLSDTISLSAFNNASKEVVSPEHSTQAQDTQAKITTDSPSLHGDLLQHNSVFDSQDIVDKKLIEEMRARPSNGGYVHIFWSGSRKLCKIGRATSVYTRGQQSQAGCQLHDIDHTTVLSIFSMFPQRVTKLVHLELKNFQANLSCEGHHHPQFKDAEAVQSEHGEWFDVTSVVAMRSVFLWCDFTRLAYTSDGTIKEEWIEKLTLLPKPSSLESSLLEKISQGGIVTDVEKYHHERRKRYERWIKDGSA